MTSGSSVVEGARQIQQASCVCVLVWREGGGGGRQGGRRRAFFFGLDEEKSKEESREDACDH
jgi:hypothetical protein